MDLLSGYDQKNLTVASLGGHSALDVCHGAKKHGFKTLVIAQKGREKTYEKYFKSNGDKGCVDDVIVLDRFQDVLNEDVQKDLRERNTVFIHNRYFWVYFDDFAKVESGFGVPIFGSRHLLKLEERDQPFNQFHVLNYAGIRTPRVFEDADQMDGRLCIIKGSEADRGYERAFFLADDKASWEREGVRLEKEGRLSSDWRNAPIEEFVLGAPVNFNYFYSPLTEQLELMGTDMRRQTNLDGFLRLTAPHQEKVLKHMAFTMVETGHTACSVKESILEKAFDIGEKFVTECKKISADLDPVQRGIIGPFALQGAVTAEDGSEDIVIFDVSFRIPGSPGTRATPYSGYLYGESLSMGERIAMEIKHAVDEGRLDEIVT
jgi:5-formaminoimidazole-4-carboxamide-1-(beta)-D-ribofuranosyl 5'-monophosphate synthetase